jgi:hypothetical protein
VRDPGPHSQTADNKAQTSLLLSSWRHYNIGRSFLSLTGININGDAGFPSRCPGVRLAHLVGLGGGRLRPLCDPISTYSHLSLSGNLSPNSMSRARGELGSLFYNIY